MEVGEGVSVVKGPIRGICATIINLRRFAFGVMFHLLIVWAGKLYGCSVDYK